MGNDSDGVSGGIIQNQVNTIIKFKTSVYFKNGAKETIFHTEPPKSDPNRMIHFKIADDRGVAFNLDEVRKYEVEAFFEKQVNIIS